MQPSWTEEGRTAVNGHLRSFFQSKLLEARNLSPRSIELVEAVDDLTMRGGKRLRPLVAAAGLKAVAGKIDWDLVAPLGSALELLQSYLLIHDDWMDLDETRRGGPSVHAAMEAKHGDPHLGASLAVLAGDLASAYANEVFAMVEFPESQRSTALDAFWQMQREVFFGQHLDVVADDEVERMYDLKTGSYTVRGPLLLGAMLGDATSQVQESLRGFAQPLGVAFQLRDELLGTFGDSEVTGKPSGNDIRAGKLTVAIKYARSKLSKVQLAPIQDIFGVSAAGDDAVSNAVEVLESCGAKAFVEARLAELSTQSRTRLVECTLVEPEPLFALVDLLTLRSV